MISELQECVLKLEKTIEEIVQENIDRSPFKCSNCSGAKAPLSDLISKVSTSPPPLFSPSSALKTRGFSSPLLLSGSKMKMRAMNNSAQKSDNAQTNCLELHLLQDDIDALKQDQQQQDHEMKQLRERLNMVTMEKEVT